MICSKFTFDKIFKEFNKFLQNRVQDTIYLKHVWLLTKCHQTFVFKKKLVAPTLCWVCSNSNIGHPSQVMGIGYKQDNSVDQEFSVQEAVRERLRHVANKFGFVTRNFQPCFKKCQKLFHLLSGEAGTWALYLHIDMSGRRNAKLVNLCRKIVRCGDHIIYFGGQSLCFVWRKIKPQILYVQKN